MISNKIHQEILFFFSQLVKDFVQLTSDVTAIHPRHLQNAV